MNINFVGFSFFLMLLHPQFSLLVIIPNCSNLEQLGIITIYVNLGPVQHRLLFLFFTYLSSDHISSLNFKYYTYANDFNIYI